MHAVKFGFVKLMCFLSFLFVCFWQRAESFREPKFR